MTPISFKKALFLFYFCCFFQQLTAQYTVNGDATQDACNQYTLTPDFGGRKGSVWNNNKINLTQSFDFKFDIFLGTHDSPGADGIAFVLQPISTSVGGTGSGLGYAGISPAVGVTIDTYQNSSPDNDPSYDHIAIQLNGDLNHATANNIAGPVTAISGNNNIEDGQWHSLRIQWNAATNTLTASVDGTVRVSVVRDFINNVFGGNPLVYWGFTGSTGGESNLQQFKTALNPAFNFPAGQKRCVNEPIQFLDATISFSTITKFYWNFGDGSPIDSVNLNPVHVYTTGGDYTITQRVIGADGCEATNTQVVRVGTKPEAGFRTTGNCISNPVLFTDTSKVTVGTINSWYWDFGDLTNSAIQNPSKTYATAGDKLVKFVVKTIEGCESDTLPKLIHIYSIPTASFTFTDSVCIGTSMYFFDNSTPNGDPANTWEWTFDDSVGVQTTPNAVHYYLTPGIHSVTFKVSANGSIACNSTVTKAVFVVDKPIAWFRNNTICHQAATTLTDSSYTKDGLTVTQWWWQLNGGITGTQNTITTTYNTSGTDTVKLVVHNSKGCASDTLKKVITINAKPVAKFGISNLLCDGLAVNFTDSSAAVSQWSWIYNYAEWSNQNNTSKTFTTGNQRVGLVVTNAAGCKSDTTYKTFYVNPVPNVTMTFKDACKFAPVSFTAVDNSATVTQWKWEFGDGAVANSQNATHTYNANGVYKVKLFATAATTGCYDGKLEKDITIYGTNAFAGNDTIAAAGQPVMLHASGGISYSWNPASLLNDATSATPITTLQRTQTFTLKAFTPEGCESYDDVTVKIYKGPDIYLPNAFTPNGDNLNDVFRGIPVGLKELHYIKVFNRWGQLVFNTADYRKGWDGTWLGQKQPGGVYVVIASGTDYTGKPITKKGSVILIR